MSLEVKALTKIFEKQKALDQISFSAQAGQILGFLGPNGAGKSTTMKIAAGYLLPDEGDVWVQGMSVLEQPKLVSKILGYLPENNPLYLDMYVREFLKFVAGLYQLKGEYATKRIDQVVDRCGLGPEQHKKIGQLSKGYRQRVGLAKTLVHDPLVIILDEPTTGLDPNQLVEIRKLIKEISKEKTLILSTHVMQEVELLCDKVVIIHQGKIVAQDLLQNLKSTQGRVALFLETEEPLEKAWFVDLKGVKDIQWLENNSCQISTDQPQQLRKSLLQLIQEKNLSLNSLKQQEQNLEAVFHDLTGAKI
ncbi:gliding motility-associated ABC transporter ATP-binding subunit GldA [Echinicola jeungdonensis]|uniref:Gliding motility-associated ABC transporter ATP-binding subunit GldA n=1 Tax=Echinicola jeungdonensis TaxID=709343 RepID=A0ABV5J158_9BACT|nr:gliding motility-associated ABC transporter ATP-binding subunit GldA [Echinicola jeungdonensis]MDN3668394.1 gliding motility-associated ABC transporter ATP-binding subunit GldA [Echinicola jeungdonensis]